MTRRRRVVILVAVVVAALVVAAVAVRVWMVWDRTRDVLPTFSPIPDGPRAPVALSLLGTTPGETTLAEVRERTAAVSWACRDTSMRGLMQAGRDDAKARMAEAKARGDDPDTVAGASRAGYYSKKERNPQVQWTCEDVALSALPGGEAFAGGTGAVTWIFDSAALPLRAVIVSRRFMSQREALAAFDAGLARHAPLGAPTTSVGAPVRDPSRKAFERLNLVSVEWAFADRRAVVSVMNYGPGKGIDVREVAEVPWPVTTSAAISTPHP